MINDIEERYYLDLKTVLFHYLARKGMFERFSKLHTAAGKFPFASFVPCLFPAFGKKNPVALVVDDGTDPDPDAINPHSHAEHSIKNPWECQKKGP